MPQLSISTRLASNFLTCKFKFDRPVNEFGTKFFRSAEDAAGSPIPQKIFSIEGVTAVKVDSDSISVTRDDYENWPEMTRVIAGILRSAEGNWVDPAAPSNIRPPEAIRAEVEALLEAQINPAVASHGGEISLIDVKGTTVYVKLGGGCQGCGMASVTLKQGVERTLRDALPELDEVLDTTDHASGENPYYSPSKK